MEKEMVQKFDLEAAFKALNEIDTPKAEKGIRANRVDLKERFAAKTYGDALIEDYYNVNDKEALEEAKEDREEEVAKAKLARIEKIVDLDAESPEDLLPSYVGKVIIQCPQCMTLFYKNPEDIEKSEENPDVVNINEICQHCGNASGYTLIGKVGEVSEDEAANYEAAEEGTEEDELNLDFGEPTEEVSPEGTGGGFEEEEIALEEGSEDSSDDELDLDLAEVDLEPTEESLKHEQLNEGKIKDYRDNKDFEETDRYVIYCCDDKADVIKTVKVHGTSGEVKKLMKDLLDEHKDAADIFANKIFKNLKTGDEEEVELDSYTISRDVDESLEEELTPEQVEQRLTAYAASLGVEESVDIDKIEKQLTEGIFDIPASEFKELGEDDDNWDKEAIRPGWAVEIINNVPAANITFYSDAETAYAKYLAIEKGIDNGDTPLDWDTVRLWKLGKTDKEDKLIKEKSDYGDDFEESVDIDKILDSIETNESLKEELTSDTLIAISYALKGVNSELDKNPKYLKNGKHRYFFHKNMPVDLQAEWIVEMIQKAAEQGHNQNYNIDDVIKVWDMLLAKTCNPEALAKAYEILGAGTVVEGYTGNPAERTTHLEYTDDDPADDKAVLPDNIEKQLTEEEKKDCNCKDGICECGDKKLAEGTYDVSDADFRAMLKDKTFQEFGEALTEEKVEESKVSTAAVEKAISEISAIGADDLAEVEESCEHCEGEECEQCTEKKEECKLGDKCEELHEESLNKHISNYLTEVYANVKDFTATGCALNGNKLVVEGIINFNSGKVRATKFEFTEAKNGEAGKIILKGYNKDLAEDAHFTLNCLLEDGGTCLLTEGFGYKYTINNTLVEGLK